VADTIGLHARGSNRYAWNRNELQPRGLECTDGKRMPSHRRITPAAEVNLLWASSRNQCAEPNCTARLVEKGRARFVTHGRIAHIFGHSPGGPRWAAPLNPTWVDSHENLLILCQYHHDLVDADDREFPASELQQWKNDHAQHLSPSRILQVLESVRWRPQKSNQTHVERVALNAEILSCAPPARIAITGMAGTGKSELAARHFSASEDEYTQRIWISGQTRQELTSELAALARAYGRSHTDIEVEARMAIALLDETPGYLVVLDGVADIGQLDGIAFEQGTLMVTSQSQAWPDWHAVVVSSMSGEEGIELLRSFLPSSSSLEDTEALTLVSQELSNIPILLAQAGQLMATSKMTPRRYLEILHDERGNVLWDSSAREKTLYSSLAVSTQGLPADAIVLARTLAFLAPAPISMSLDSIGDMDLDPSGLSTVLSSGLRTEKAIAALLQRSLVFRDAELVRSHALVQEYFRARMTAEEQFLAYSSAIQLVITQVPPDRTNPRRDRAFLDLVPHLESLYRHGPGFEGLNRITGPYIANRLGSHYIESREWAQGRRILVEGTAIADESGDQGILASLIHNIANSYLEAGELDAALTEIDVALRLKEQLHAASLVSSSDVARTLALKGDIYGALGEYEDCLALNERAAELHVADGCWALAAGVLITCAGICIDGNGSASQAMTFIQLAGDYLKEPEAAHDQFQQIRHALTSSLISRETGDFVSGARSAMTAESITKSVPSLFVDYSRALLLRAQCLSALGEMRTALALLKRAVDNLNAHGNTISVSSEKTRGNIGMAFVVIGCFDCGIAQTTQSLRNLSSILGEVDTTVVRATQMVDQAHEESTLRGYRSVRHLCPCHHRSRRRASEELSRPVDRVS